MVSTRDQAWLGFFINVQRSEQYLLFFGAVKNSYLLTTRGWSRTIVGESLGFIMIITLLHNPSKYWNVSTSCTWWRNGEKWVVQANLIINKYSLGLIYAAESICLFLGPSRLCRTRVALAKSWKRIHREVKEGPGTHLYQHVNTDTVLNPRDY